MLGVILGALPGWGTSAKLLRCPMKGTENQRETKPEGPAGLPERWLDFQTDRGGFTQGDPGPWRPRPQALGTSRVCWQRCPSPAHRRAGRAQGKRGSSNSNLDPALTFLSCWTLAWCRDAGRRCFEQDLTTALHPPCAAFHHACPSLPITAKPEQQLP